MADELLIAQSNKPGSRAVTLVSGTTATGYQLLEASPPDFGLPSWDVLYSGPRGTQGSIGAGAVVGNRTLNLPLLALGSSHDDLEAKLSVLWGLDDEMRRYGGIVTFRPKGGSFKAYYDVLGSSIAADFSGSYFRNNILPVRWAPICAPYLSFDAFDIYDGFDTDTNLDYAQDAIGGGFSIAGGVLIPTATGTARWRHTGRGYLYTDAAVTLKATTGSTVVALDIGVFMSAPTSGIETILSANLTGGNIAIVKRTAGSPTTLASTAFALSTATTYWLRLRRVSNFTVASVYTSQPTPLTTASATVNYTLDALERFTWGAGQCGFRLAVVSTQERYDDFWVEPMSYGGGVAAT